MNKCLLALLSIFLLGFSSQLTAQDQAPPSQCKSPESRQFDFWVGDWEVVKTGTTDARGLSSVQLILGDCVILENYTYKTYAGKSLNVYNASLKKWQQFWVDNTGQPVEFIGEYKDQEMKLTAESLDAKDNKTLRRMTFSQIGEGRVRQLGENSKDNGKTWTVTYDLTYTKKN